MKLNVAPPPLAFPERLERALRVPALDYLLLKAGKSGKAAKE